MPLSLADLFLDLAGRWPRAQFQSVVGVSPTDPPDPTAWLATLVASTDLHDVRFGALHGGRVAASARCTFDNGHSAYVDGFPIVHTSMPDVLFRIHSVTTPAIHLYVSESATGTEVVIEGLPVDIVLPAGLVEPPLDVEGSDGVGGIAELVFGGFIAGKLDSLRIEYRRRNPTIISVHIRVHVDEAGNVTVRTAVPIVFGKCRFMDLPCRAVHDFTLLPAPAVAHEREVEWLRHDVAPFLTSGPQGAFAVRSIELDYTAEPFLAVTRAMNNGVAPPRPGEPPTEFVLEDLVFPLFAPYGLPIPRHVTLGLRRRVVDRGNGHERFDFTRAPVRVPLGRDPAWGFYLEKLSFESRHVDGALPAAEQAVEFLSQFEVALGLFSGNDASRQDGVEFALGEDVTPRIGYRRTLGPDGLPRRGGAGVVDRITHFALAGGITIDIMAVRIGFSIGNMVRSRRDYSAMPGKAFCDHFEAMADLFVVAPPTGGTNSVVRLRTFSNQRPAFALENLGYKQGSMHMEGVALPSGTVISFGPPNHGLDIVLRELSVIAQHGASYLCISAGVQLNLPGGCQGGVEVRRMRIKLNGLPTAPPFLLDGVFLRIRKGTTVTIDFGGAYSELALPPDAPTHERSEFALTGRIAVKAAGGDWSLGGDFLFGAVRSLTGSPAVADNFAYALIALSLRLTVVAACFEFRGAQVLVAINMQPALEEADRAMGELRYYEWYRTRANPLQVASDRRLAAWTPRHGTYSFGVGLQASFPSCGKCIEFSLFVMGVCGDDERGLLIAIEARLMSNPNPVGWGVLEWDGKHDTFSLLVGVDIGLGHFLKDPPEWVRKLVKLSGTLFIANRPTSFALGRLRDMDTWLSLRFEIRVWFRALFQVGVCMEMTDGADGQTGAGLVARFEGGWDVGIFAVTWNLGLGVLGVGFRTGSTDTTIRAWIEGGLRLTLFGFFRLGISAGLELRHVGARPARTELHAELRLETPWFLPDVVLVCDHVFGTIAPEELGTSVQPIRRATTSEPSTGKSHDAHAERFDAALPAPRWDGLGPAPMRSVAELRGAPAAEADRVRRFDEASAVPLTATDSTIAIELAVAVDDQLAIAGAPGPAPAVQRAGDLTLRYELVGVTVRRRARYGADRAWHPVEERLALPADFSDPRGVALTGSFGPTVLAKSWDPTVLIDGRPAAKKLLLNAETPFEVITAAPEVDERIVRANTAWPCCPPGLLAAPLPWRVVSFEADVPGAAVARSRTFTASQSVLSVIARGVIRAPRVAAAPLVAVLGAAGHGTLFRALLVEDAALVAVRLAWTRAPGQLLELAAYGEDGARIGVTTQALDDASVETVELRVTGSAAIRRVDLRLVSPKPEQGAPREPGVTRPKQRAFLPELEIERVAYVALRDQLARLRDERACREPGPRDRATVEGRGKLFLLPNTDYEVGVQTRITIEHPTKPAESATVTEYAYVRTKGLPGLNACARTGEELSPYVERAYTGGRGVLYRDEPITLAFREGFQIAVPLARRTAVDTGEPESAQLLRLQLVVRPDVAATEGTVFTASSDDWLTAHRPVAFADPLLAWRHARSTSQLLAIEQDAIDPLRARLAQLTQRPEVECDLADPRDVTSAVLVAPPPGPAAQWQATSGFLATVCAEGAPFIERAAFVTADVGAFAAEGAWRVEGDRLHAGGGVARFGEDDWNHVVVQTAVVLGAGRAAGVGVALRGEPATGGLVAFVERTEAGARLVIAQRGDAGALASQALPATTDLAAPVVLQVSAFDDRLRAAVGEIVVEVARDAHREGRLCLFADGEVAFASLHVTGLPLYAMPFRTSRYASFAAHIGSFDGIIDSIGPDALGAGTTTATVEELWATHGARVAEVMQPAAAAADRQALFDAWLAALGLPLRDEVTQLELSRYVRDDRTSAFLLESPEPLDFTEEIAIAVRGAGDLQLRVLQDGPGRRALLVPTTGPFAEHAGDKYEIHFRLDRARFRSRGTAGGLDRYRDDAVLIVRN